MGLINNILSIISLPSFGNLGDVVLKREWICKIIGSLINFVGDVGLGIILFTLILKLITLPLDIYSRASMKKNSLKMEMMKDDLEKLKKQYKNNEQLYQQKMMSLYKKNGYSAFSACLPTIVTLVFFIIVIGAFNDYSRYADKEVFNQMGKAYDAQLVDFEEEGVLIKGDGSEAFILNINSAIKENGLEEYFNGYSETEPNTQIEAYALNFEKFVEQDSLLLINYPSLKEFLDENGNVSVVNKDLINRYTINCHTFIVESLGLDTLPDYIEKEEVNGKTTYYIRDLVKFCQEYDSIYVNKESCEIKYAQLLNGPLKEGYEEDSKKHISQTAVKLVANDYLNKVVKPEAREASAKAYEKFASKSVIFPWVKNLWVVDSPFKYAIPEISELEKSLGAENMGSLKDETVYNELTYNLKDKYQQKGFGKGNGLFILVALSIITMLGSTLVMNKQQKTQMQLSSVQGENSQAASTQKMMTWMMPIMFGIFAFIYSAAFSIYMITSSLLSTGFTLLINFFVERAFKKQIEEVEKKKAEKIKYGKRR